MTDVIRARALATIACGLLSAILLASPSRAAKRPTQAEVAQGLTCQCGCGLTVANCNMPTCSFAVPAREDIDSKISSGMSRDLILTSYREKYGEKVLSAPTTTGFNLLAWTMPFMALAFGGAFIVVTARRWHSEAPAEPASPTSSPSRDSVADFERRRRLEKDIREQF